MARLTVQPGIAHWIQARLVSALVLPAAWQYWLPLLAPFLRCMSIGNRAASWTTLLAHPPTFQLTTNSAKSWTNGDNAGSTGLAQGQLRRGCRTRDIVNQLSVGYLHFEDVSSASSMGVTCALFQ
jgi:hypothetical protein